MIVKLPIFPFYSWNGYNPTELYDDPENYLLLNQHRDDVGDIWRIIHKYKDLSFRVDEDAFLEILKKNRKYIPMETE